MKERTLFEQMLKINIEESYYADDPELFCLIDQRFADVLGWGINNI